MSPKREGVNAFHIEREETFLVQSPDQFQILNENDKHIKSFNKIQAI